MDISKEKFDIIIEVEKTDETCVSNEKTKVCFADDVFFLETKTNADNDNKPFSVVKARENEAADYSVAFADLYIRKRLEEGRKVLIIRIFADDSSESDEREINKRIYLKTLETLNYALLLNPSNRLVAFLWGYNFSGKGESEVFKEQLAEMLYGLRLRLGRIPFIAIDFSFDNKKTSTEATDSVSDAINDVFLRFGGSIINKRGKTQIEIGNECFAEFEKLSENDF